MNWRRKASSDDELESQRNAANAGEPSQRLSPSAMLAINQVIFATYWFLVTFNCSAAEAPKNVAKDDMNCN
jgi:hypothetical protein